MNAPSAPGKPADAAGALSQIRMASIAPSLDWAPMASRQNQLVASVASAPISARFGHNWYEHLGGAAPSPSGDAAGRDRLALLGKRLASAKSVAAAEPSKERVARAAAAPAVVPLPQPAPERFLGTATPADAAAPIVLAYADPSPTAAGGALEALLSGDAGSLGIDGVLAKDDGDLPEDVPVPLARPKIDRPKIEEPAADKADVAKPQAEPPGPVRQQPDASARETTPAPQPPREKETKMAFARPDNPAASSPADDADRGGGFLRRLFGGGGRARAGDGVAVYDISAQTVYMPDGTRLEAHSGVGEMADDPRYVHVKMNGPTPPHTYVLQMREKRFHGVEAIRMLPENGRNLYGRDGFLTHSYLMRGRRAQSHGCVAFADYPRFLAAFKAGKVKKLVVVSGSGKRNVRIAKHGQGA
jgi:hypothetical protein